LKPDRGGYWENYRHERVSKGICPEPAIIGKSGSVGYYCETEFERYLGVIAGFASMLAGSRFYLVT
jgi:hypothetical protein